jgi:nucleoid-associated protein YgaU
MTRESKIALLVGLGFIICFGVIISGSRQDPTERVAGAVDFPVGAGIGRPAPPLAVPLPPVTRILRVPRPNHASATIDIGGPAPQEPVHHPSAVEVPPAQAPQPLAARVYTVEAGDSLSRIAAKAYGLSTRAAYMGIYEANRDVLSSPSVVVPGQRLRIPPLDSEQAAPLPGAIAPPATRRGRQTYTVQRGDTLTAIARKTMGTSSRSAVQALHELNRRIVPDPDRLRVGAVLVIPQ